MVEEGIAEVTKWLSPLKRASAEISRFCGLFEETCTTIDISRLSDAAQSLRNAVIFAMSAVETGDAVNASKARLMIAKARERILCFGKESSAELEKRVLQKNKKKQLELFLWSINQSATSLPWKS
ncbi:hypothetical protein HY486_02780 [Candidatus Woesearchaeota archaeon]|nr:hypothetical protein [Candidatus Woesearchaeota archaeon]